MLKPRPEDIATVETLIGEAVADRPEVRDLLMVDPLASAGAKTIAATLTLVLAGMRDHAVPDETAVEVVRDVIDTAIATVPRREVLAGAVQAPEYLMEPPC